jgi:hypothetical protein
MTGWEGNDDTLSALLHLMAKELTRKDFEIELNRLQLFGVKDGVTTSISSRFLANSFVYDVCHVPVSDIIVYDVCVKDCLLFWRDFSADNVCSVCKEPRYNQDGTPRRRYPYVPLIPRIRRYFADKEWSTLFAQTFESFSHRVDGQISDVCDGSVWRYIAAKIGGFTKYTVPFFFGADGMSLLCIYLLLLIYITFVNSFTCTVLRHYHGSQQEEVVC